MVTSAIGFTGHFDGVFNVLFLLLELLFELDVNVFHGIFLFSQLVDFLSEFVVIGAQFIKFLICPHEFIFKIFSFLNWVVKFGGMCNGLAVLLIFIDFEFLFLFFRDVFLNLLNLMFEIFIFLKLFLNFKDVRFFEWRYDKGLDELEHHWVKVFALSGAENLQILTELLLLIVVENGFGDGLNFKLDFFVEGVDALVHEFEEDFFDLLFDGWNHDDFLDDGNSIALLWGCCSFKETGSALVDLGLVELGVSCAVCDLWDFHEVAIFVNNVWEYLFVWDNFL